MWLKHAFALGFSDALGVPLVCFDFVFCHVHTTHMLAPYVYTYKQSRPTYPNPLSIIVLGHLRIPAYYVFWIKVLV